MKPTVGQRLSLLAISSGLRAVGTVSTTAAARLAGRFFLRPPPVPMARNVAGEGQRVDLRAGGSRALAFAYGSGPAIYLLHGWGGRGHQLSSFVAPLVAAGRTAVLLDAPGHGEAGGRESSVIALARTLRAASTHFGPAAGVIAHSLGAMATILAIADGWQVERVVFLAPGSSIEEASGRFQKTLSLPAPTMAALKRQMEQRFHTTWSEYDAANLKLAHPLWVVHDRQDDQVPLAETEALLRHWPGAHFELTQGLGHYRVMRNQGVISGVVRFLTAG